MNPDMRCDIAHSKPPFSVRIYAGGRQMKCWVIVFILLACALMGPVTAQENKEEYNKLAWESFYSGVEMLEKGSSRADVLARFEVTLKTYGQSRYKEQLLDLIGQLGKQVEEDKELAKTEAEDPETLPPDKRIAYYVARLPDVHGQQYFFPGHCLTINMGEGTKISDALVAIGRPAVPALIKHLNDRRLTRSIGFHRPWAVHRTVLRGQDVAIQCIVKIFDIQFYHPSSTSSYLSNEKIEIRDAVIADIKSWWEKYGDKSPLEGFLGRLEHGGLNDRLGILNNIEEIDKTAVDSVAVLKHWAVEMDRGALSNIANVLANRGDFSLLPSIRKMVRSQPSQGGIDYILRYGDAGDYRYLLQAAREDIRKGATSSSSRVFGAVRVIVERSKNPLAVPILVDFLDRRETTSSRSVPGVQGSIRISWADKCMGTLISLTNHNEGYKPADAMEERYEAIDRWIDWWRSEGKVAYIKQHPEVAGVIILEGEAIREVDPADLPPLVSVLDSDIDAPIVYEVPRTELVRLVQQDVVEARLLGNSEHVFQFASRQTAAKWFEQASPLLPPKNSNRAVPLVSLGRAQRVWGPRIGPDGRAWLWRTNYKTSVKELMRSVETAADQESPVIEGAEILSVDRRGRIWLLPDSERRLLLGYDPEKRKWIRRPGLPEDKRAHYKDKDPMTASYVITGPCFESRAGRLFFGDRLGVHMLDGDTWTYQFLFERNIRENRYYDEIKSFNEPRFCQDAEGRVYVWSNWGRSGWTGTIGYWVFDGKEWKNIDTVERVQRVIPRGPDETWIVDHLNNFVVLKEGKAVTEENAKKAFCPNMRFQSVRPVVRHKDGRLFFRLEEVSIVEPFEKVKHRMVALPAHGPAQDLGEEITAFFGRIRWRSVVAVSRDGWIWGSDGRMIEAISPDGKESRVFREIQNLMNIRIRKIDGRGNVYLTASGQVWRFDPRAASDPETSAGPLLPAMRVNIKGLACPDSLGRMWCRWDVADSPMSVFEGGAWRTMPEQKQDNRYKKFISAFPGADGSMVFVDDRHYFHLHDADGWVIEKTPVDLALKHGSRLREALAYPPVTGMNFYSHLVKDAHGRISWAHWYHKWVMVDGDRVIDVTKSDLKLGPARKRVLGVLMPLGNGTRVLACDEDGAAAIIDVVDGRIVKVADSPVSLRNRPTEGWRSNVLRDSEGWVWIMTGTKSVAVGEDGKAAASIKGWLMLEDRDGGRWFNEPSANSAFIVRVTPADRTRLEVPALLGLASMTEAPDGTVWALTSSSLIRVKADGEKLAVVENYPLRISYEDHIWCDRQGRVWHLHRQNSGKRQLVRYATTPETLGRGHQD